MTKANFLFEIGTEEIPADYLKPAVEKLQDSFTTDLKAYNLSYDTMQTFSTPRRLAIRIIGLDSSQADQTIEKSGPAKKAAYTDEGKLTKAGEGFLKGAGAEEKDIYIQNTPKGEYIAVKVFVKGKETEDLLPTMCQNAVSRIIFPKTMRWGGGDFAFARPIRWFVTLYDQGVFHFELNGIKGDRFSQGIRYRRGQNTHQIGYTNVSIADPLCYEAALRDSGVITDRNERKDIIQQQINAMGDVLKDERLLDTVTDIVEFPTAVRASFSENYLGLPPKIITSTLSQNQKYFSCTDASGNLTNDFVFISNGDPACADIIRVGNEKVVKARLEDAQFYFTEDTKKPLESYVERLKEVVFQADLGTLLEKTERISALCENISSSLDSIEESIVDMIQRAALLAKADLVTQMLGEKEFTKLQGYIGMNYALLSGENTEVAKAIYEHYMPRGQNDDLPSDLMGAVVAIADKLDTVCGIIGVGLIPTGSADPFGLRRAANGIVQIIDKYSLNLSISKLINQNFSILKDKIKDPEKSKKIVSDFIKQRIKWLLEELYKVSYDVLDSLDIFEWDNIPQLKNRAIDLSGFKAQKEFETLVIGYKRVNNILEKNVSPSLAVRPDLLLDDPEKKLFTELNRSKEGITPLLDKMAYKEAMQELLPLGAVIDTFFEKTLVMCEDTNLKNNRLALLKAIKDLFLQVADISKINYEN
ncbi:MAG: glycine--tRNA ligase subunit beta [Candidatus Cloacimonetes bacterium]|nr:glycine--tRNA ligase subunit beta [Candidatus Cloacimonadota bacterium]